MVDAWTKQVLENGPRNYRAVYTIVFASTSAITGYTAADPTSNGDMGRAFAGNILYPGIHLTIWEVKVDASASQGLKVIWKATADQTAWAFNGQGSGGHSWKEVGGLKPYSNGTLITGATGIIAFDTLGTPAAGDLISVELWLKKDYQQ